MELQGRILHLDMASDDLALLHKELLALGFTIPREELERRYFGQGAEKMVKDI